MPNPKVDLYPLAEKAGDLAHYAIAAARLHTHTPHTTADLARLLYLVTDHMTDLQVETNILTHDIAAALSASLTGADPGQP